MSARLIGKSQNTVVMNKFLKSIGFNIEKYCFKSLESLDNWCFKLCGTQIKGIIICFKDSKFYNQYVEKIKQKKENMTSNLIFDKDNENENSFVTFSILNLVFNLINEENNLIWSNSLIENLINKKFLKETGEKVNKLKNDLINFDSRYSIMLLPINNEIYEFDNNYNNPILKCNIKENNFQKKWKKCIKSIKEIDPLLETFEIYVLTN